MFISCRIKVSLAACFAFITNSRRLTKCYERSSTPNSFLQPYRPAFVIGLTDHVQNFWMLCLPSISISKQAQSLQYHLPELTIYKSPAAVTPPDIFNGVLFFLSPIDLLMFWQPKTAKHFTARHIHRYGVVQMFEYAHRVRAQVLHCVASPFCYFAILLICCHRSFVTFCRYDRQHHKGKHWSTFCHRYMCLLFIITPCYGLFSRLSSIFRCCSDISTLSY